MRSTPDGLNTPDAAILCGGQGTRLRSVLPDLPKPMAPLGGRPFLERLIVELREQGIGVAVLCTGYGREIIRNYFATRPFGVEVRFSEELSPLGTGGALVQALPQMSSDPVLVLNGDSYPPGLDLRAFIAFHGQRKARASLVVVPADERDDAGNVLLDSDGRVGRFAEKQQVSGRRYHSAGIYLLSRARLARYTPGTPISMERDLLPDWIESGLDAYVHDGPLYDIGTPERWTTAEASEAMLAFGEPNSGRWK